MQRFNNTMPNLHKLTISLLVFVLSVFIFSHSMAQNEANPFEQLHRIDAVQVEGVSIDSTQSTTTIATESDNPFDIKRSATTIQQLEKHEANTVTVEPSPTPKKKLVAQGLKAPSFLFWVFSLTMLLLTILVTLYKSLIVKIYKGFLNDNFLKLIQRDQGGTIILAYFLLILLFFISLGTLFYLYLQHFGLVEPVLSKLLYCILGVALVFVVKLSILSIAGFVFPVYKEIRQYTFTIIVFSIILGLLLLPFNILIAYAPTDMATYLIYLAFLAIILVYLFRTLRGVLIASKYISLHKFHFFMYLCAVEIAPLLVLFKSVSSFSGI